MTLEELKQKAINITPGYAVKNIFGDVENVSEKQLEIIIQCCEGCYGSNNGSVAFVSAGRYYVIPFTTEMICILETEGFKDEGITVIMYGAKRPADPEDAERWRQLEAEQDAAREKLI